MLFMLKYHPLSIGPKLCVDGGKLEYIPFHWIRRFWLSVSQKSLPCCVSDVSTVKHNISVNRCGLPIKSESSTSL